MSVLLASVEQTGNTGEQLVFWVCAVIAVVGALGMILSRRAVHSALFIATTMISLAVLYIAQGAPFLGMAQIVVYTGAVMMLFLFVLMLIGVDSTESLVETLKGQRIAAVVLSAGFAVLLFGAIGNVSVNMAREIRKRTSSSKFSQKWEFRSLSPIKTPKED